MVKVIVRRASTGVAAASTLLVAAGGALGCGGEAEPAIGLEPTAEADLELSAGSATLVFDYQSAPGAAFGLNVQQSTTDEIVRVGETLSIEMPAWVLWQELYPQDPVPSDAERLKKLQGTVSVRPLDKGKIATITLPIATFTGTDPYDVRAHTNAFIVPAKTDALGFEITIKDAMNPAASVVLPASSIRSVQVFGGDLPNKTLFFDTSGGPARRQRVIEGNNLIAGADFVFSFSDWRADVVVDKGSIDMQIGVATVASRFGFVDTPIYGKLAHEVSYAVYFNDALGWRPETGLPPTQASRLLPPGRTSFEATINVPAKATKMSLYAHVKTHLVADYSGYSNIKEKWYADNEQVLVKDQYDNPFGAFTNYDYSIQN
jgi:hypothetical protein